MRHALAAAILLLGVALAPPARAQDEGPVEVAAARDAFRAGLAHAQAGRWPEAREAFERSHRLAPRAITLLNLAGAQAQTGALVLAAETYRRFLRDGGPTAERHRRAAEAALGALDARIPTVRFAVEGLRDGDVVLLDGAPIASAILEGPARLDPGDHVLEVRRAGELVGRRELALDEGAETRVDLHLAEPARAAPEAALVPDPVPVPAPGGPALHEEPLFWIVLVGALVLGGVGVGLGIHLSLGPISSSAPGERTPL